MSAQGAAQAGAQDAAGNAGQPQNQPGIFTTISRMVMMYCIVQWIMKSTNMTTNAAPPKSIQVDSGSVSTPAPVSGPTRFINAWQNHAAFDLEVYLSANDTVAASVLAAGSDPKTVLAFTQQSLTYDWAEGNYRPPFNITLESLSPALFEHAVHNGTVWAHAFFTRTSGRSQSNPVETYGLNAPRYRVDPNRLHVQRQVNLYKPPPPVRKYRNLMADESSKTKEAIEAEERALEEEARLETLGRPYVSYWQPDISLRYVHDLTRYDGGIPAPLDQDYTVMNTGHYLPMCYFDEFWQLKSSWILLNSTVTSIPMTFSSYPTSILRWKLTDSISQQWKMQSSMGVGPTENELQEFKRMFIETDPWLLGLVAVVSTMHMLFDFLAFQSDISFWKNTQNRQGLSFSSIFFGAVSQLIIFLYLLDNETSWMVLLSTGVGVLIEAWKLTKATDRVKLLATYPFIQILDVDEEAEKLKLELESKPDSELTIDQLTDKYDKVAFRYMSYLLVPLVGGYSIYSLYYETHKSWYSWIVASLVGVIYMFGFITMLPQLYLNYKLKSVAHLPWKMLTYKALNTFIDDIFAFIIKMPTLHRLACLRDDVVFVIFLYQKWKYRTDYARVNEFGIVFNADGTPVTVQQDQQAPQNKPDELQQPKEAVPEKTATPVGPVTEGKIKTSHAEVSGLRSRKSIASTSTTTKTENSDDGAIGPDEVD